MYGVRLAKEPLEDVLLALEKLAEMPRKEYEPAMLEIGAVIALVKTCTLARHNRIEQERKPFLVRYQCPDCHVFASTFTSADDFRPRQCHGIPRDRNSGKRICGAVLVEVYRENMSRREEYGQ